MKPFDSDEEEAEQLAAYQKELRREWGRFSAPIRLDAKKGGLAAALCWAVTQLFEVSCKVMLDYSPHGVSEWDDKYVTENSITRGKSHSVVTYT